MPSVRRLFSSIRGHVRLRTILFVLCAGALAVVGAPPAWWAGRGVTNQNEADDYAPINQGQLKNLLKSTALELDEKLPGGAGETLHQMIAGWANPTAQPDDYAAVNVGQLKAVAKAVYDRLMAGGIVADYPWKLSSVPEDDFALANIGQAKSLFAFTVPTNPSAPPESVPILQAVVRDWWIVQYELGNSQVFDGTIIGPDGQSFWQKYNLETDPTLVDTDGDGISDYEEVLAGTNPIIPDNPKLKLTVFGYSTP